MKLLSLFSGIGAFEKALDRLRIDYALVGFSEIDKYAVKSYCAIHGVDESMNLGDITKVDENSLPKDIDLITYGFPCQDISLAGKQKGLFNNDGTQTRSGLFFEALRIIEATKPKIAIAENVKNLTGKKFKEQFELVLKSLEEAGYSNYWKVLNAKDYGIPQNRERVFIISIRKDIDKGYEFPEPFPLQLRLKDMLDAEVDEKFYLSEKCINGFVRHRERHEAKGTGFKWEVRDPDGVASCLRANSALAPTDNTVAIDNGVAPTVKENHGTVTAVAREESNKIMIDEVKRIVSATRKCDIGVTVHDNGDIRPHRLDKNKSGISEMQINKDTNISNTVTASHMSKTYGDSTDLRIRKLTPKECWRLMGFDDEDFYKAEAVNSNTQLYKQAGNSIVVNVLEAIFTNLRPYMKG